MEFNPYELIYMSRTGDQSAVQALFSYYGSTATGIVGGMVAVYPNLQIYKEDMIQEGKLAILEAIETYRDDMDTGIATYINVLTRRRIYNQLRRIHASTRLHLHATLSLDAAINEEENLYDLVRQRDPMNDPEFYMQYRIAEDHVNECISRLNDTDYEVYKCMYRNESYSSAAQRMNISKKGYDGRTQRIRRKIKDAVYEERTQNRKNAKMQEK